MYYPVAKIADREESSSLPLLRVGMAASGVGSRRKGYMVSNKL